MFENFISMCLEILTLIRYTANTVTSVFFTLTLLVIFKIFVEGLKGTNNE